MKKIAAATMTAVLFSGLAFGTAHAFTDVDPGQSAAVHALKERGIVSGMDGDRFAPKSQISYAQTVQMIVKAFDFNLDAIRFIKAPVASELYDNVRDDAWYAEAFIIAHYNGLDIPRNVDPNAAVTRERFGDLLVRAMEKKADLPMVKMFIQIQDENQIEPGLQGALQRLLLYKIEELDKDGNFRPKSGLTRGEAAVWVHKAMRLVADHTRKPETAEEIAVAVEKVNDEVNKVTLSRGQKPSAGYGIAIESIRFEPDGRAVIRYTLTDPKPGDMAATVVTEPKAVTYVSSKYNAVAEPAGGED
ncbi:S-layer homology domain-containing protein [Paenibacillus flagellatus]|uniref:S-layer protein n=1 Tax=Paenibacillus flagellatus TaxID=2211139 RepID=A0A2V5KAD4_9BACL|nr:S-layer homology domain-containing protein [Paenibacillus flagellatus]PYI56539.1 S-layer protein [Paenibacillus flagellatus]